MMSLIGSLDSPSPPVSQPPYEKTETLSPVLPKFL